MVVVDDERGAAWRRNGGPKIMSRVCVTAAMIFASGRSVLGRIILPPPAVSRASPGPAQSRFQDSRARNKAKRPLHNPVSVAETSPFASSVTQSLRNPATANVKSLRQNIHHHNRKTRTMADSQLYEDTFHVTSIDNAKYDRVTRIAGTSADSQTTMTLDVNSELYPIEVGETVQLLLASTLNLDGTKDERGWRELDSTTETTLADMYDYVCHGKVYRFEEGDGDHM